MDDSLQRRLAGNEALLRQANEAIQRGLWPGDSDKVIRFRCECGQVECNQAVELAVSEYEAVRANPRRFVLVAGHEQSEIERVIERRGESVVVEKIGQGGVVAEERDPRS